MRTKLAAILNINYISQFEFSKFLSECSTLAQTL